MTTNLTRETLEETRRAEQKTKGQIKRHDPSPKDDVGVQGQGKRVQESLELGKGVSIGLVCVVVVVVALITAGEHQKTAGRVNEVVGV